MIPMGVFNLLLYFFADCFIYIFSFLKEDTRVALNHHFCAFAFNKVFSLGFFIFFTFFSIVLSFFLPYFIVTFFLWISLPWAFFIFTFFFLLCSFTILLASFWAYFKLDIDVLDLGDGPFSIFSFNPISLFFHALNFVFLRLIDSRPWTFIDIFFFSIIFYHWASFFHFLSPLFFNFSYLPFGNFFSYVYGRFSEAATVVYLTASFNVFLLLLIDGCYSPYYIFFLSELRSVFSFFGVFFCFPLQLCYIPFPVFPNFFPSVGSSVFSISIIFLTRKIFQFIPYGRTDKFFKDLADDRYLILYYYLMYSLILLAPFFTLLFAFVFSFFSFFRLSGWSALSRLGGSFSAVLVLSSTFVSMILSLDAFFTCVFHSFNFVYSLPLSPLFRLGWVDVEWSFFLDSLTAAMFVLITVVSFFIQLFSFSYMSEDASRVRFMFYLCFFMVAMLLLVSSPNLLQMFFGWELVGLASFLLINFWFARNDANAAAFKAMAFNRVGDCFFVLSIIIFAYTCGSWSFDLIFCVSYFDPSFLTSLAFFFLIIAAFAKSAQFFFHSWLPDAMEGPTPVSALLHSATMVTAGVFLMLRCMDLLEVFPYLRYLVTFFGLLTAFYAMSIAAVADDTKRVTAYTTLNQLGFMFYGCGSLAASTVLFHLVVHGFYKSFSFLTAAVELHDLEDEQDGETDQLESHTPTSYDILSSLAFFSINAIPFTSPSVSKEFMLLSGLDGNANYFTYLTTLILFTGMVDEGRDDVESDFSDATFYSTEFHVSQQPPSFMLAGCSGLAICSIFSSSFLEEIFLDLSFSQTNSSATFFWLDVKGSLLIALPFFSLMFAEFDSSSRLPLSDFGFTSILSRKDSRYQAILFNSELWNYDLLVARISATFYKFGVWQNNFVLDKGFLEQLYVFFPVSGGRSARRFIDVLYGLTVERVIPAFVISIFFWFFFSSFYDLMAVAIFSYVVSSIESHHSGRSSVAKTGIMDSLGERSIFGGVAQKK